MRVSTEIVHLILIEIQENKTLSRKARLKKCRKAVNSARASGEDDATDVMHVGHGDLVPAEAAPCNAWPKALQSPIELPRCCIEVNALQLINLSNAVGALQDYFFPRVLAEIVTITEQKATLPELPWYSPNFIRKPSMPLLPLCLSS